MIQILREQTLEWPTEGPLTVVAPPVAVTISVSPEIARRRANGYLAREVAMTLLAHNPRLVVGECGVWRLNIDLSLPDFGRVAPLGVIDVDAENATVIALTTDEIDELLKAANALAARFSSSTAAGI